MVDKNLLEQRDRQDAAFFQQHPDRQSHIRQPVTAECRGEFWKLGTHDPLRRRIILWRVPETNPAFKVDKQPLLKIPFVAFMDETIEDRDDVLLPIIHDVMTRAAQHYGMRR